MPKKPIESLIFTIRGKKVILDADLARIYGIATFRFNEAFKRNRRRFPDDFAFQLTTAEFAALRAGLDAGQAVSPNSSQFAMSSTEPLSMSEVRPWAMRQRRFGGWNQAAHRQQSK